MPVIKYDASDVEAGGGGVQADPGLYRGKVVQVTERKKKADGTAVSDLEVVVDVGAEFARLWTYIPLKADAPNKWKLREFTDALGLPPKGGIDPKKEVGKAVNVKVVADTDLNGDYRGKIKNLYLPVDAANLVVAGEASSNGTVAAAEGDYEPWTEEELKGASDEDITATLDELNLTDVAQSGRGWKPKAIAAILEAQEAEPEADPETEPEAVADGALPEGYEDIDDWTADDLKEELAKLELTVPGRFSADKAKAAILEQVGGGDGDAEPEAEDTYDNEDEWPDVDLQAEIDERNEQGADIKVPGRKSRQKMIDALRADNALAAKEPF